MKRQTITIGSFIQLKLPCNLYAYGRIITKSNCAFYNIFSETEIRDIGMLERKPVLFIVAVYNNAVNSGRWLKIGTLPLGQEFEVLPYKFMQDILNPSKVSLYNTRTGEITPSNMESCIGLEKAAVWEAEHIEERLCDHFHGRENEWVEELKLKIVK